MSDFQMVGLLNEDELELMTERRGDCGEGLEWAVLSLIKEKHLMRGPICRRCRRFRSVPYACVVRTGTRGELPMVMTFKPHGFGRSSTGGTHREIPLRRGLVVGPFRVSVRFFV